MTQTITFNVQAKNEILKGIKDYSASGVTNAVIGAYIILSHKFVAGTVADYNSSEDKIDLSIPELANGYDVMTALLTHDPRYYEEGDLLALFNRNGVVKGDDGYGNSYWKLVANTDEERPEIERSSAFAYKTPTGSSMEIPSNQVIFLPAGSHVNRLKSLKNSGDNAWVIFIKDIAQEDFVYAGSITITSATITISDEV